MIQVYILLHKRLNTTGVLKIDQAVQQDRKDCTVNHIQIDNQTQIVNFNQTSLKFEKLLKRFAVILIQGHHLKVILIKITEVTWLLEMTERSIDVN